MYIPGWYEEEDEFVCVGCGHRGFHRGVEGACEEQSSVAVAHRIAWVRVVIIVIVIIIDNIIDTSVILL
jgi:hypothetical protein